MKLREFVLLVLIVAAGVFLYHVQTGKLVLDFDWEDGFFLSFEEYLFEESVDLEPPFPPELQLINAHGDLDIKGSDTDRISIRMIKRIRRRNQEQAEEVAAELRAVVNRDERNVTVTSNRSDFKRRKFRTDFHVTLPSDMAVRVKNSHGSAALENLVAAHVENTHGAVTAGDIAADLTLRNSYEDVLAERIGGECQIESRHSRVEVSDVRGRVHVTNRYGRIDLSDISREVSIEGAHTWISGRRLTGGLEIDTSYEGVDLIDSGPALIRGLHTFVNVERMNGRLEILDQHSDIEITGLQGDLQIMGKSLKITASDIVAENLIIDTSHQNVDLKNFSGQSTISLSHGELKLMPAPLTGSIEVKGRYAGISFIWPGTDRYPFEAQNKGGNIDWQLSEAPSLLLDNGISVVKAYSEETSRPAIKLATSYAPIIIGVRHL